jgi:hypothetical protein
MNITTLRRRGFVQATNVAGIISQLSKEAINEVAKQKYSPVHEKGRILAKGANTGGLLLQFTLSFAHCLPS